MPSAEDRAAALVHAFAAHELCKTPDAARAADMLLHHRQYLDEELTLWTASDLADVLLGVYPAKVVLDGDEIDETVVELHAFFDFLASTARLDPESDPVEDLHAALDEIAEELPDAMADTTEFGIAKTLALAMAGDGVDITDAAAVERWIDDFNSSDPEARHALFGEATTPARLSMPHDLELPPAQIAPHDELAAAARSAPPLARLRAFTEFIGRGRPLTSTGNLKVADGVALARHLGTDDLGPYGDLRPRSSSDLPEVDLTFAWADAAGFVDITPRGVVATAEARAFDDEPLEAWWAAFEGLLEVGPLSYGDGWLPWADMLEDGIADLVVLAHLAGLADEALDAGAIAADAWQSFTEQAPDLPPLAQRSLEEAMRADVEAVIDRLVDLGVVERRRHEVSVTPLGSWAALRLLRDDGYEVPVAEQLASADAATLLRTAGSWDLEDFETELDRWLAARPAEDAVHELADAARALRASDDVRPLLLHAFGRVDPGAEPALRALQEDPWLRAYATAGLVERGLEPPASLGPGDLSELMVDQLAVLLAGGGPSALVEALAGLGPAGDQAALMERLWRADHPAVVEILDAVGRHHPDKVVAKAARKALFKLRSAPR